MSTINTGKFNWYIGSSADKVDLNGHPDVTIRNIPISSPDSPQLLKTIPQTTSSVLPSPLPIVQQPLSTEFQEDILPLNDSLDIKPTPTEPSRIFDEVTQAVSPLVDRISRNLSPKEPSRIRRDVNTSFVPSHVAQKHSLVSPISSPSSHIKRQKLPMSEFNPDPLHLNDCDFNDFNTVSGSDSVDFWFSQRVPSDIISLEEGERKLRMTSGVDSVLLGKMHRVQKEYMSRVRPLVPVSMIKSNVDSISHMKDELLEKSSELMNSAKDAFTMGSISSTLKEIAEESTSSTRDGEPVSFFWPARVPSDVSSATEKARSEWMEMHIEPYFKSQWKQIHASLLRKLNGPSSLMARTFGSVLQITSKFGLGAIDLALDALHLGVKDLSGLESVRMLEEQERSRRMALKTVDPILDIKKSLVERELLSSLKFNPMM